jgi:DNA-binding transcriptional MerR regulator
MLKPLKRSGGRRYYRPEDVKLVDTIDRLVNREGYTLRGARQSLENGEVVPSPGESVGSPKAQPDILPQLRSIRDRLASAVEN